MPLPINSLFYDLRKTMTEEQEYFVSSIIDYNVVFCNAKAGTGKTTMAYAALYYLFETKKIDKIYYIFSPVEESKMGFRPGTQEEKEAEYRHPLNGAMLKVHKNIQPERAIDPKTGWVEAKSHTFLRGTTIERAGVIIDEAQNYTLEQLKKTLTRIDDSCHVVVIGHDGQVDLPAKEQSGFVRYLEWFAPLSDRVRICELTKNFRGWISQHADAIPEK